jgi:hypothetical protein
MHDGGSAQAWGGMMWMSRGRVVALASRQQTTLRAEQPTVIWGLGCAPTRIEVS